LSSSSGGAVRQGNGGGLALARAQAAVGLVHLGEQGRDPNVGGGVQLFEEIADALVHVVLTDRRGDGGDEAERRRRERRTDGRGHHGQGRALLEPDAEERS